MDQQLGDKVIDFLIEKPKFKKYLGNLSLILAIFAKHHPMSNVVPDFELKRKVIEIEGEKLTVDYDNKIFGFTNHKPGNYTGKRFGWKGTYFGLNGQMLRLAKRVGFSFKIISPEGVRLAKPDLIKKVLSNIWAVKWIQGRGLNIYAVPLRETIPFKQQKNQKISEFI